MRPLTRGIIYGLAVSAVFWLALVAALVFFGPLEPWEEAQPVSALTLDECQARCEWCEGRAATVEGSREEGEERTVEGERGGFWRCTWTGGEPEPPPPTEPARNDEDYELEEGETLK